MAVISFVLITLLFFDFTGTIHLWFGWMAKIQLIPAILAVNVVVIVVLVLITLLFGRIYCSVICPLGIMQDGVSHISGRRKGKKSRFSYSKAKSWLRYGVLVLFIGGLIAGISVIVSLLDPYAGYGRIASELFAPVYMLGNNLFAWFAERADSYAFYSTEVWIKSCITFSVAIATLLIVGFLAWRNGRTYCNTICPVGTLLGLVSRFSIMRPVIDPQKCNDCGLCEKGCKASCIDHKSKSIDMSRCVTCFNCIDRCKTGAMRYTTIFNQKRVAKSEVESGDDKGSMNRRSFVAIAATLAATGAVKAQQQLVADGGLADIEDKMTPDRKTPLVPPGAQGVANMKKKCTACQLCVSSCPNKILRPSGKLETFMQPEMSFECGFCRPECVECSQVCPSGAIKAVTTADKAAIAIGHAVWIKDNCVVNRDNVQCTACERHCPTDAITLVVIDPENRRSLKLPTINKELCIGCGACEHHCPVRPFSAMYVEGNLRHHSI